MMYGHIADAIKYPALIRLTPQITVARFEVLKVYSALAAVEHLLERKVVARGDTLIDSSSGIYAYALALACHKHGMRCHIIASRTVDPSFKLQLELLGAFVEPVPPAPNLRMDQKQRVARIHEILATRSHCHWMQQYHDEVHYLGYEPIARQMQGETGVDELCLIGGVGSGASTGGLARYLRAQGVNVCLVGVQPFESVTFGSEHILDPKAIIAGIGSAIPFRNVDYASYDVIHWISFETGLAGAMALVREQAIFAGLSSGCCYAASLWEARQAESTQVLMIVADTGHRYMQGVFAMHEQARPLTAFEPMTVHSMNDMQLPWSRMLWNRRAYVPGSTEAPV